ncbi:MAG: diaminopimelate decarboxylase [Anaerolineae bacterium]
MQVKDNQLYLGGIRAADLAREYGTPLYVYEEDTIRARYTELVASIPYGKLKIHYACKANANVEILRLLRALGANVETVSKGEILLALKAGFKPSQILYTCSNITVEELRYVLQSGATINIDSLTQLERCGEFMPGSSVSLRVNQGIGAGHHAHVITGGPESKFGIDVAQLEKAKAIAAQYHLTIIGVHQHIGSNIVDEAILLEAMRALLATAARLPHLEFVDFGGGLGIPYRPNDKRLNIHAFGEKASALFTDFCRSYGKELTMVLEPGRYLVAEAGTLLATVTDVKRTPHRIFVGIDSGFNHLIRPAMYSAYHPIVNASRVRGEEEVITVAGNLCESGDVFARDRKLTVCEEGDVLAILNAGAYGFAMSSNYNARPRPAEILVGEGRARVIRERERIE